MLPEDSVMLVEAAGDSAYALRPWIMTQFLTPSNECERRYNNAHKRTRNIIERTFGLLKARFRCLHSSGGALQYTPITAFKIVVACAILHNIATRRGLPLTPADPDPDDEEQEQPHRHHGGRSIANQGRLRREHIANQYFGRR
ncbi:putative nuclease HARBI1 [Pleurodeles waltl]|uniref:putative nuclease HARBI1 n=1 Tax=Pleurodeles waltl TaxID=8319 RepID=UPI003709B804